MPMRNTRPSSAATGMPGTAINAASPATSRQQPVMSRRTGTRSTREDSSVPENRCGRNARARTREPNSADPVRRYTRTVVAKSAIIMPTMAMTWAVKMKRNSRTDRASR